MIIIVLFLCLLFFSFKLGGTARQKYVKLQLPISRIEKIEKIITKTNSTLCPNYDLHYSRIVPHYTNLADVPMEKIYYERNICTDFSAAEINVTRSHTIGCIEFISKFNFQKIILIGTRVGIIPYILTNLFPRLEIHYFFTDHVWDALLKKKNIIMYNRMPIQKDFKKLQHTPLINLLMIRDDSPTISHVTNQKNTSLSLFIVNYMIKHFMPPVSLNLVKAVGENLITYLPAGIFRLIPFAYPSSFMWLEILGSAELAVFDSVDVYKSMMIFMMCQRNKNYNIENYKTYDSWAEAQIINDYCEIYQKNFDKTIDFINSIIGAKNTYKRDPAIEISQQKRIWVNKFYNPGVFGDITGIFDGPYTFFEKYVAFKYIGELIISHTAFHVKKINNFNIIFDNELEFGTFGRIANVFFKKYPEPFITHSNLLNNVIHHFAHQIPTVDNLSEYLSALENHIKFSWKLKEPESIWLWSGAGYLLSVLHNIFKKCTFNVVSRDRFFESKRVNYLLPFKQLVPDFQCSRKRSYVWYYITLYGKPGDFFWNNKIIC